MADLVQHVATPAPARPGGLVPGGRGDDRMRAVYAVAIPLSVACYQRPAQAVSP